MWEDFKLDMRDLFLALPSAIAGTVIILALSIGLTMAIVMAAVWIGA
jgi:flagellar biosynthesis protein FliQ